MPTNEWYQYLSDVAITADNVPALESSISELEQRVETLEQADGNEASIQGGASIEVFGTLAGGFVQVKLKNDLDILPAWHYYGTDALGEIRTFHEFPDNLQQAAGLAGVGFITIEGGVWEQRSISTANGITLNDDGTIVTFSGNPFFVGSDDGDAPIGPASVTADASIAAGAGAVGGHLRSVALGSSTATDDEDQIAIGPRDLKIQGNGKGVIMRSSTGAYHAVTVNDSTILFDGAPISGGGSGFSYFPSGW
jgi:hypothetical protein